ncbi:DUF1281 family ferredoxin-like fold protein [Acinetobacter ursingii]|uniref:DUF1281 family ferredoxin-like fold protein n=1 Tax=Acinetobacter ursingii TaxID=108980 RepID=UPI0021CD50FC|nr:hypothetical protein [Acinetobacter ursingii]MCU4350188.1 hypothetical protein [Acinetobacter ursingii]
MPNHVTNKIEITSKNAKEALEFMQGSDRKFDFNNIITMPQTLNVESGTLTDAALAYALTNGLKTEFTSEQIEKYFEDGFFDTKTGIAERNLSNARRFIEDNSSTPAKLMQLGQQIISNVDQYGYKTWYEWSIPNWGTKWNAYEVNVEDNTVSFDTAWNSPDPVLTTWIAKFNLDCIVKAFDEGHNFWFIKQYENGVLVDTRDTQKEDRDSLCKELKGYDPSEEDED